MRKRTLFLALLMLIFPTALAFAQTATPAPTTFGGTAPGTFNDALADLNSRLGTTLTLDNFNNPTSRWQWQYREFSNTALDCAAPGEAFAVQKVLGYEYVFVYFGRTYDYRVPEGADKTKMRYCRYWDKLPVAPPAVATNAASTTTANTGGGTTTLDSNGTPVATTTSNEPPGSVQTTLADLNTRLGTALTLDDLAKGANYWRWTFVNFTNDALECPKVGYTPILGTYPGYKIVFFYKYVYYEYRVPQNDANAFFLCRKG